MAGLLCDQGEVIMLEAFLNKTAPQSLRLKLFKNNVTPAETDTEAMYTEANFPGYADILLTPANWVTVSGPSSVTYPQQTFTESTLGAGQNVYGYYIVQTTSGKLVVAERFFDGPYFMINLGDAINLTPQIFLD